MKQFCSLFMLVSLTIFAQERVHLTLDHGVQDTDLQTILLFENISLNSLRFEGDFLKDKYYVLRLKEFVNGREVKTSTLFDERGTEYFKMDTTFITFQFLSKIEPDNLKLWIKGSSFGSKHSNFKIDKDNGKYVVKDFLGISRKTEINADSPFYLFAVITPNRNPDGSASYCKVAQSDIAPEKFGEVFNIPHYFLVEMEFLEE